MVSSLSGPCRVDERTSSRRADRTSFCRDHGRKFAVLFLQLVRRGRGDNFLQQLVRRGHERQKVDALLFFTKFYNHPRPESNRKADCKDVIVLPPNPSEIKPVKPAKPVDFVGVDSVPGGGVFGGLSARRRSHGKNRSLSVDWCTTGVVSSV